MCEGCAQTIWTVSGHCWPQQFFGVATRKTEMREVCLRALFCCPMASAIQTFRVAVVDVAADEASGHPPTSPELTMIHVCWHAFAQQGHSKLVPCVDAPKPTVACFCHRHGTFWKEFLTLVWLVPIHKRWNHEDTQNVSHCRLLN